jgi:hypothetical protein
MTQSVFRDLYETRKELKDMHSLACFVAVLVFLVFAWRLGLSLFAAFAIHAIWPSTPFWPIAGLVLALTFLIPQQ